MSGSLLDSLLVDSQTNYLKEKCPSLFDDSGAPAFSYNNILSSDKTLVIPDSLKYYQLVENGNNYVNDLLEEEEKYLKQKYGESLYKYFVTKREDYINNKMKSVCSTIVSGSGGDTTSGDTTTTTTTVASSGNIVDPLIVALRQQLNSYEQSLRTYNEVTRNNEKSGEAKLLNARKFYYRSDAMNDADKMDMMMTGFLLHYFGLLYCIFGSKRKGRFQKKWWVYALLILLPMILSKMYSFFVIRFIEMKDKVSDNIPRKAFLNQN